jgi:hypothetical protein
MCKYLIEQVDNTNLLIAKFNSKTHLYKEFFFFVATLGALSFKV